MEIRRLDVARMMRLAALVIAILIWLVVREALHGLTDADPFDLWGPHRRGS